VKAARAEHAHAKGELAASGVACSALSSPNRPSVRRFTLPSSRFRQKMSARRLRWCEARSPLSLWSRMSDWPVAGGMIPLWCAWSVWPT